MKKHRGWIILALIVALAAAGIWLIGKVIAVYPGLGDPVSYPVNQVDGVTLTIEAPSFSPFQGYTIAWKVTADSDDVYHFTCDGEAPNTFEFLERKVDGQWYRLAYTQNDFPYSTVEFALGGEEKRRFGGKHRAEVRLLRDPAGGRDRDLPRRVGDAGQRRHAALPGAGI